MYLDSKRDVAEVEKFAFSHMALGYLMKGTPHAWVARVFSLGQNSRRKSNRDYGSFFIILPQSPFIYSEGSSPSDFGVGGCSFCGNRHPLLSMAEASQGLSVPITTSTSLQRSSGCNILPLGGTTSVWLVTGGVKRLSSKELPNGRKTGVLLGICFIFGVL